jgi:hypothetical protein
VTYNSKMVLQKGQREIQILFLGRDHTGGDTVKTRNRPADLRGLR